MEIQGLFTSSNLVRGTMKDRVAADYSSELFKQTEKIRSVYGRALANLLKEQGGINNE